MRPIIFCKKILPDVSRSFALSIPLLDSSLYEPVLVAYLHDRILDSFEDEIENISVEERKQLMNIVTEAFNPEKNLSHELLSIIRDKSILIENNALRKLAYNIDIVRDAFEQFDMKTKENSYKWLAEMNKGMQIYLTKEIESFEDLDEYSYYVASTVGGFLTELLIQKSNPSEEQKKILLDNYKESGLFLQKINIIRDISNDIKMRKKVFWPLKELNLSLDDLKNIDKKESLMEALDKMIKNVESHIDNLVKYYDAIPAEFSGYKNFYALNNVLGLKTIEVLKNNEKLFFGKKPVKVSKSLFLKILQKPAKNFEKEIRKRYEEN